jgi:flap endonuclease-1
MGIKNLLKFISEYPNIIKYKDTTEYIGKKIAIDISILLYQVIISIRSSGSDLTNSKGEITSHILGLFNKTLHFLDRGITPVYVFDGKPPKLKSKILDTRKQIKLKALEKLSQAISKEDKIKYLKRSVYITKEHIDQCKELLSLMGIPFIIAPEEADSELSYLCKTNMVYAVLTEDMDILTFGSPKIIRNLISTKNEPFEIDLNDILTTLNLKYEEFIELCILFGCDYCSNISDIKTSEIYKSYYIYRNIPDTINDLKNKGFNITDFEYQDAKDYFINSVHNDYYDTKLELSRPNINKLLKLLVSDYGFIKFKILSKLNRLMNYYNISKTKEYVAL